MCECIQTCSGKCVKSECKPKPVPHKHAALIKAWADGAKIEYLSHDKWFDIGDVCSWSTTCDYRIKPEPKPDVSYDVRITKADGYAPKVYASMPTSSCVSTAESRTWEHNTRIVFDGETGKLKSVQLI